MRTIRQALQSLCVLTAAAVLLAGCGGTAGGSLDPAASAPSAVASAPSSAAATGGPQLDSPKAVDWARPPLHRKVSRDGTATWKYGYSPAQIRHAYGFDLLAAGNNGAGQTIAIVDAYNAPTILKDANVFSTQFALPQFNATGGPRLTVVGQTGGTRLPKNSASWAQETSLDVEWAHALAPQANVLLVEASSASFGNLLTAVDYAAKHAQVVSMSWGGNEFSSETSYDSHFNVAGVVCIASSGDSGGTKIYPSVSPYVLSVGGTSLPLDASGNRTGAETAWSGGGGGISAYESEPTYQSSYPIPNTNGYRGDPDVSYEADPNTGVAVYDSTSYSGQSGWLVFGGTSVGAPQWSALTALANQLRGAPLSGNSLAASPFYNAGVLAVYVTDYLDITSGSNGNPALVGYDFATGLGSPQANNLVPFLQTH